MHNMSVDSGYIAVWLHVYSYPSTASIAGFLLLYHWRAGNPGHSEGCGSGRQQCDSPCSHCHLDAERFCRETVSVFTYVYEAISHAPSRFSLSYSE